MSLLEVAVTIEVIQYMTALGSAVINDVISYGFGGVIGVMVAVPGCEVRRWNKK